MSYTTKISRSMLPAVMLSLLAVLSACSGHAQPYKEFGGGYEEDYTENDPLEPINRGVYKFNEVVDGLVLKPVAHIYRGVVPEPAQDGVRNALNNIASPVVLLNSLLQGDFENASNTVGRFLVNTTVGIAGLFDVASSIGMERHRDKDFGQTLGVHGVGTGPYIVLPVFGPSNARDAVGLVADMFSDPMMYILSSNARIAYGATRGISKRAALLPITDQIERNALDPYTAFRSSYLQNRRKVVRDYLSRDARMEENKNGK